MKKVMRKKLLALILACMMMVPATAMADNGTSTEESTVYEQVQDTEEDTVAAIEDTEAAVEESSAAVEESTEVIEETGTAEAAEAAAEETTEADGQIADGLVEKDGKIYCYENNELVYGLKIVETDGVKATYYFGEDGAAITGYKKVVKSDGSMDYYYFCQDGKAYTDGFLELIGINGKTYYFYFTEDGRAYTQGFKFITERHKADADCNITDITDGSTYGYYFTSNGQAYTKGFLEFVHTNGKTYYFYFQTDGSAYTKGYKKITTRGIADADGNVTRTTDGNSYYYYFKNNGQAYTKGFLEFVHTDGKTYYAYFRKNGTAYCDGLKKISTGYAADANGNITKKTDGNSYYYYFKNNGQAFTKGLLQLTNSKGSAIYMYFQKNGQAYTKGYKSASALYKASSACKVSKTDSGTKYYYYFKNNGKAYTGGFLKFVHTNGKTYNFYFQSDGKALTSTDKIINKRYTADVDGNFTKITDDNYYGYSFASNGKGSLISGWAKINDTWNWFDQSTGVRKFKSDWMHTAWNYIKDRSSGTSYYVVVDTENCRTFTFKGSAGNWVPYLLWKCSPGKPSTPTVKGTYSITGRGYSFSGETDYTCYYYTQFYGNYLFHSVLYYKGTMTIRNGTLGKQLSHGCVRLSIENAKWFYDNLGNGSKVYIY